MPLTPEEKRERQRAYYRRWYEKNRKKVIEKVGRSQRENREKHRAYMRAWKAKNREKINAANKGYRAKYPEKFSAQERQARARQRAKDPHHAAHYWAKRRAAEAGRPKPDYCDVCGRHHKRIVFDHCHQRDVFRGWLCHDCNLILGHAHDNPDVLLKLVAYLKRTAKLVPPQLSLAGI